MLPRISGYLRLLSNKAFLTKTINLTFKLRPGTWLFNIEIGNLSLFIQVRKNKKTLEIYAETNNVQWNDIILLFGKHFLFKPLKNSCSESKIDFYTYLKKDRTNNTIPILNAKIRNEDFKLYCRDEDKLSGYRELIIDRNFLTDTLLEKRKVTQMESFIHYGQIPQNIINAVICTEDLEYFNHHGVCLPSISYAIRENIRTQKIARGGSTITMQLVRNLFLSNDRTVFRKVEECILSILMENHYQIGKTIIMELYLNMIELAPNIYGIKDASCFYFGKSPEDLSLTEIIVLTYIIPRPVHFYEALKNKTEQLQRNLYKHVITYFHVMYRKGMITKKDFLDMNFSIVFVPEFGILELKQL
jgi:hypothetical protein